MFLSPFSGYLTVTNKKSREETDLHVVNDKKCATRTKCFLNHSSRIIYGDPVETVRPYYGHYNAG